MNELGSAELAELLAAHGIDCAPDASKEDLVETAAQLYFQLRKQTTRLLAEHPDSLEGQGLVSSASVETHTHSDAVEISTELGTVQRPCERTAVPADCGNAGDRTLEQMVLAGGTAEKFEADPDGLGCFNVDMAAIVARTEAEHAAADVLAEVLEAGMTNILSEMAADMIAKTVAPPEACDAAQ
eukprot:SAG31_NODE_9530_length_1263_cov_1.457045_1_plen_183_part_10